MDNVDLCVIWFGIGYIVSAIVSIIVIVVAKD